MDKTLNKTLNSKSKDKGNNEERDGISLQKRPVRFEFGNNRSFELMIDKVFQIRTFYLIAGWCSSQCRYSLNIDGVELESDFISVHRKDVNEHLAVSCEKRLGFVLLSKYEGSCKNKIYLKIHNDTYSYQNIFALEVDPLPMDFSPLAPAFGNAFSVLLAKVEVFSDEWFEIATKIPSGSTVKGVCEGTIETAQYTAFTHNLVIMGWIASESELPIWIQDTNGERYAVSEQHKYYREDVSHVIGNRYGSNSNFGTIFVVKDGPEYGLISVIALSQRGPILLGHVEINNTGYNITEFADALFSLPVGIREFARLSSTVYQHLLSPCIASRCEEWKELPVQVRMIGTPVDQPKVSVIIPLYGRYDFADYQIVDFMRDEWFQSHCELIYVVDDQYILSPFLERMELMFRLHRLPMKCVWGGTNRGFSGANNFGASVATANTFLFLNSDVFPESPGWIERLYEVLYSSSQYGAVGARLLRADGSIQHAGMNFRKRAELGVWVTEHPFAGCAPELDPAPFPMKVPAVTGACLMVRREHFEQIGGWNQEYLIGDFEDSDLCFKLQQIGLNSVYCPDVQLTHLERCSMALIGTNPDFRQRITIYNAVLHQEKWKAMLESKEKFYFSD